MVRKVLDIAAKESEGTEMKGVLGLNSARILWDKITD
jgi:hypothetical protein